MGVRYIASLGLLSVSDMSLHDSPPSVPPPLSPLVLDFPHADTRSHRALLSHLILFTHRIFTHRHLSFACRRIQNMGFIGNDAKNGLWMTLNGGSLLVSPCQATHATFHLKRLMCLSISYFSCDMYVSPTLRLSHALSLLHDITLTVTPFLFFFYDVSLILIHAST